MKRMKKAIGYVCDIPVDESGMVITKDDQRLRILKYAEKEGLELVCIYEDENYVEPCITRPGVKKLCEFNEPVDLVIVERVWAFSRKMKELEPLLARFEEKKVKLVCTSYLWDCVSQQVRHRFSEKLGDKMHAEAKARADAKHGKQAA